VNFFAGRGALERLAGGAYFAPFAKYATAAAIGGLKHFSKFFYGDFQVGDDPAQSFCALGRPRAWVWPPAPCHWPGRKSKLLPVGDKQIVVQGSGQ
jgi:hypothetical protein